MSTEISIPIPIREKRVSKRPMTTYVPDEPKKTMVKKQKKDKFPREYVPYDDTMMNYLFTNYKEGLETFTVFKDTDRSSNEKIRLTNSVFVYRPSIKVKGLRILRHFGTKEPYVDPGSSPSGRTLVPPDLEEWEVHVFQGKIQKPTTHFLAIPLVMIGERTKAVDPYMTRADNMKLFDFLNYKEPLDGEHSIVLLYNMETKDIDIIDDKFFIHQLFFNYGGFLSKDLKHFLKPILKTFGLELNNVYMPMIKEKRKGILQKLLKEKGYPIDFDAIYKTFLANYLKYRMLPEYRSISTPELLKNNLFHLNELPGPRTPPEKIDSPEAQQAYIESYEKLTMFRGENPYVSRYIPLPGTETRDFDFYKPCPDQFVRNFHSGKCEPEDPEFNAIDVLEKLHVQGKNFYPRHSQIWFTLMMRYFADKYKHLGIILPENLYNPHPYYYSLRYAEQSRRVPGTRSKMLFTVPPSYSEFVKDVMNDPSKTLVVIFVSLIYKGSHANPLIIDKIAKTVERIEVNAPALDYTYGYNSATIDEKLKEFFEQGEDMKPYGLTYIPALEACPYGLHRAEYREVTSNVKDIGGRCAEWSIYYLELRAANPTIPREKLYSYAHEKIRKTGSVKHFIAGYMNELVKESRKYRDPDYSQFGDTQTRLSPIMEEGGAILSSKQAPMQRLSRKTVVIPYLDIFDKGMKKYNAFISEGGNSHKKTFVVPQSEKQRQKKEK